MHQKIILIFFSLFILFSFSWLAYQEKQQEQIHQQWFLYFSQPSNKNLDFVIENYTENNNFQWILFQNNQVIKKGTETIYNHNKKEIKINSNNLNGKLVIQVKHQNNQKEIYKIFSY